MSLTHQYIGTYIYIYMYIYRYIAIALAIALAIAIPVAICFHRGTLSKSITDPYLTGPCRGAITRASQASTEHI